MKLRNYLIRIALLLSFLVFCGTAFAEDAVEIDCKDSQNDYGARVAALHSETERNSNSRSSESSVVLCRTDGSAVDFEAYNPKYIVYGPRNCVTLLFNSSFDAALASAELTELHSVIYAECDSEVSACETEQTSFRSWGADKMNFGVYLDYCKQRSSGGTAEVAVIDSGMILHNDLKSRILETGYDYVDKDNDPTNDIYGHGTGVAGIISDCTSGLPVYLYPIRILDGNGRGYISNAINAIREAAEKNVDVINLSFGSTNESMALHDAINDALGDGVCVVVSAGNGGIDASDYCPAHMESPGLIVVGSVEDDGSLSSYSNYGECVDVFAYGSKIVCCSKSGGYSYKNGTSFAAPHISALAACLNIICPDINPRETEERICAAAENSEGYPIPDASAMVTLSMGFSLDTLRLELGERLELPQTAYPVSSCEKLSYSSLDESVASVIDGSLTALKTGKTVITAKCPGLEDMEFEVSVSESGKATIIPAKTESLEAEAFMGDESISRIFLPEGLKSIGEEAFCDCTGLRLINIPSTVEEIGEQAFSDTVLLCTAGSFGAEYAKEYGLNYILGEKNSTDTAQEK